MDEHMTCRTLSAVVFVALGLAGASVGCDSRGSESGVSGRSATVEYRPAVSVGADGKPSAVQKQRAGTLKKISADWVVIDEQGTEIWVPKDMVLEIRMDKK
jgi:hypothetical protein